VVFSFGAHRGPGKAIENGAPFDVFASADSEHVEQLETKVTHSGKHAIMRVAAGNVVATEQ